ncbi:MULTISPECIES: MFS transporter [unclassified Lentimicrobium]|uniref:MFS transporter n=1 Tax=unclassified Lentimicrobium TaxID=2677434 RepID=UPI0015549C35|nr:MULTISPECIES: MFS transporter [unclassified Lentimicrobium]NPD46823.1 MFS transporter [Lentimicrobium sp. S6]NPD86497.1 MFS transporter [Lentimicrobium sp. L6]
MKAKRNLILVFVVLLSFFVISFLTNILGALNPAVSLSFKLSETMAGFLPFSFFIAYGVMSIPAGFLVEKLGEKKMMLIAFIMAFAGSFLFAALPSFPVFLLSLFTIGVGMAILQVVINPLLRVSGGEEHYAFFSVLAQLIFGLASFVSPWVYSYLVLGLANGSTSLIINLMSGIVPFAMSWVSMYWVFVFLALLMFVIIAFIHFPSVELKQDEKVGSMSSYLGMFKNRIVIFYFFGIFAYVGAEQGISYWMSKFLQIYHGVDPALDGASTVANFWGLMTIGGLIGLVLLKLLDSKKILIGFTFLSIISLAIALFASVDISVLAFQSCGFFLSVMYPIIISLALNSFLKNHGSFAGILMTAIIGGAIIQLLIGVFSDLFSLKMGMMLVFLCLGYIFSIGIWAKPLVTNKTMSWKGLLSSEKK